MARLIALVGDSGPSVGMEPDQMHVPPSHTHRLLPRGTRLRRIYDDRFPRLDFNPIQIHPDLPSERGRFSSTRERPFSYLYVAAGARALRTVIWETIDYHDVHEDNGWWVIPSRIIKGRSMQEMETTRPLYLLDLLEPEDTLPLRADMNALRGNDHRVTRAWARYFRRVLPQIEGLRYNSHRAATGIAIVLFEHPQVTRDSPATPRRVRAVGRSIPMTSRRGRLEVDGAVKKLRIRVN